MRTKSSNQGAFTLIELLMVMAIIVVLMALVIPAMNSSLRASNLGNAGRLLIDQLNLARQTAQARNVLVEVRLYKLPDHGKAATETVGATSGVYRAVQLFSLGENGAYVPMAKPDYFQSPVVISTGTAESALFTDAADSKSSHAYRDKSTSPSIPTPIPNVGTFGTNYGYIAFQFMPSGSTDLSVAKNFVTLVMENGKTPSEGGNFFTVQIDPISGSVRYFRP